MVIWSDAGRADTVRGLARGFTERYDVPVRVQELAFEDVRNQLKLAAPAGEGPDIISGPHDWLGELVRNGLLEPVNLREKRKEFAEVALTAFTYEDQLYGVPYGTEALAFIYNQRLVPEPPQTWQELKDVARRLQEGGMVDQGYMLPEANPYFTYPIFTGFGGYVFGQAPDGGYDPSDVGLDSTGSIQAAREIRSMVESGIIKPNIDAATMSSLFLEERGAMFFTGPWFLQEAADSQVDYAVAQLPKIEKQAVPFVGAQGFMLSAFSENKVLARTFLTEYLATGETMSKIYEEQMVAPAWVSLQDDANKALQAFTRSAEGGQPMPAIPQMALVWTDWENALTFLFEGRGQPKEIMNDAAATIRNNIAS